MKTDILLDNLTYTALKNFLLVRSVENCCVAVLVGVTFFVNEAFEKRYMIADFDFPKSASFMQSPSSTHLTLIFLLFNKSSLKWLPNNAIQVVIRNPHES